MKRSILGMILCLILISPATQAAIHTESVDYQDGDISLQGYIAYDDAIQGKRPTVLVVHEWKGLGDYAKKRAEMLAELGYVGFAVDMYGKGVFAKDHAEAGQLAGTFLNDREFLRQRAGAGLEAAKKFDVVDTEKIAAIGYCFGGASVLEMARAGFDLKGVASFHGGLKTPLRANPGDIKAKVLILHGAEDNFVQSEEIQALHDELKSAQADWEMIYYGNAVHSFTVPEAGSDKSAGVAYDEKADQRSWARLELFLKEIFV